MARARRSSEAMGGAAQTTVAMDMGGDNRVRDNSDGDGRSSTASPGVATPHGLPKKKATRSKRLSYNKRRERREREDTEKQTTSTRDNGSP